ncbi:MAG: Spy/CpxP family protein refolding chaperone [Candidatus Acidiferrales bacterium]
MRITTVTILTALFLPLLAAAQAPAPQPAEGDSQSKVRRREPGAVYAPAPGSAPKPYKRPDLGAWWKNSDVVQELALSQEQVSQIEQAFFEHRLKLIDLKAAVEREETRLQPLMEAEQVREPEIAAQIEKVVHARGALEIANVMMMISIRKVLTVDQWKKLEAMQQQRRAKFDQFHWYIEGGGKDPAQFKWRIDPHEQPAPRPPHEFEFVPDQP